VANREHFEVFAGEDRTLVLNARDATNAVQNLSGLTIAWKVGRIPQDPDMKTAAFSKTGTISSAAAGTFTVTIAATDTLDYQGEYLHQGVTTDGSGNIKVVTQGRLKIRQQLDT